MPFRIPPIRSLVFHRKQETNTRGAPSTLVLSGKFEHVSCGNGLIDPSRLGQWLHPQSREACPDYIFTDRTDVSRGKMEVMLVSNGLIEVVECLFVFEYGEELVIGVSDAALNV
ncbi:hypothetical protein HPB51_004986 [Rhipicephalus microplus]|uniref:Uncharacterized protein n=1 Tax=Rhipicephalus microplus TaxID=6941 RepID=A0A9J6EY10_RHIMP|nr:hypothetical protein HPB51_004986 [Rhipicephalus microplus]